MKAAYGNHIATLIRDGIERHRHRYDDDYGYRIAIDSWAKGFATGRYVWRERFFAETLDGDDDNKREFAWQWFQQAERKLPQREQMTFRQFRDMWEATVKITDQQTGKEKDVLVAGQIWKLVMEMLSEKNPTPAPEANGAKAASP